jgi:membrane fusion protein (multidrug efflux system)
MDGSTFVRDVGAHSQRAASAVIQRLRSQSRRRLLLMAGPPFLIAIIALAWVLLNAGVVSTDNATVTAARVPISASVRGRVVEVLVRENQEVHAGDILFKLDDSDFRTAVTRAEAELAAARLRVAGLRAAYRQSAADVGAARSNAAFARDEAARQRHLFNAGVASRRDVEAAENAAVVAARQSSAEREAQAAALANLGGAADVDIERHPLVMQASAALAQARSDLAHTVVRAPADGVVARVAQVQPGAYVQPAQTVFWLISGEPWVEAAFKENQLHGLRPGQPVRIEIDAYPHRRFQGHVESLSPGTGSSFAVLPAENATGNWVHVVQRLNVRVAFDETPPDAALAVGLSAKVHVDTRREAAPSLRGRGA